MVDQPLYNIFSTEWVLCFVKPLSFSSSFRENADIFENYPTFSWPLVEFGWEKSGVLYWPQGPISLLGPWKVTLSSFQGTIRLFMKDILIYFLKLVFRLQVLKSMDLVLSFCDNFLLSRGTLSLSSFWDFHWCNSAMLCTKVCFSDVDFNGWLSLPSVVPTNFLLLAARCDVCHHSWGESIRKMLCRSKQGWCAGVAFGD